MNVRPTSESASNEAVIAQPTVSHAVEINAPVRANSEINQAPPCQPERNVPPRPPVSEVGQPPAEALLGAGVGFTTPETQGHAHNGDPHAEAVHHTVVRILERSAESPARSAASNTNVPSLTAKVHSSGDDSAAASAGLWRRWRWFIGVGVIGLVVGVPVFPLVWVVVMGKAQLARAIAETDALDPGWRWEDIVAARSQISSDKNGWPLIEEVNRRLEKSNISSMLRQVDGLLYGGHNLMDDVGAIATGPGRHSQDILAALESRLGTIPENMGTFAPTGQVPSHYAVDEPGARPSASRLHGLARGIFRHLESAMLVP